MWFRHLFSRTPPLPIRETSAAEDPRIGPALELERRLYESAVASVDQTFAKEGLVATFLTSGALVALAASIQAFAQIASSVGIRATWTCLGLFIFSMALLGISGYQFIKVIRGREVKDLSGAEEFMNKDPASSKQEADLKLIAEYQQARKNHMELVRHRLSSLLWAIGWLGTSMLVSFAAVLIAICSVAIHKADTMIVPRNLSHTSPQKIAPKSPYNKRVRHNTDPKPEPIVIPKPGSGTTMIKGGGGNGR